MRRSRLEIIRGILETARRGATKTQIVYKSNLNFKLADECLARLLKSGYMRVQEGNDGRAQFSTTEKGMSLLIELTRLGKAVDEIMSLEGEDKQVTLVPKLSKSY
ncbi:MAG TPA: winged helix-turn-helix domain-containing protein [Dongiaceae bacterium]|nr:winged helix-turn-helix domain-containing protein [Dongiaceae bacterium]